ncbi:hypothetical protein TspCOW1_12740 [Thiohalobacter sp. COW1]|uniref:DUF6088 family protein n=1 Tax=Thiohalobacter sp. COW1 TaxID=2795687 RepID=UPI001915A182|nr:DUF6088 family protein [Thiohalobacter sp. COW1]BCO31171.1 hypothetical protein TspCOW1_12740 [Thiohalobacter sp. COW1]
MNACAAKAVRKYIDALPAGELFTLADISKYGTQGAVGKELSRLAAAGAIERVARGIYMRPKHSRYIGKVAPSAIDVAKAIARRSGAIVQVHGAEAARQMGLTSQMQMKQVFWTSGPSTRFRLGALEIRMQHVSPHKLAMADRPAGLALTALWYLGRREATPEMIAQIRRRLPETEFEALRSLEGTMPSWMREAIRQAER